MVTAEEGGATSNTTTSSYGGGGGAGGKFRKKPFRKPTTPYDRPPVSLSGNDSSGSWLTKLVVDPASKLISYGAHRLFASVFRKRLPPPPPPPPQIPELNRVSSNGLPESVPNSQYGAQEPAGGERSLPISSGREGISELEHLLKQKTFTKSEIDTLTELLHSRAGEVSLMDDGRKNEQTASDSGRPPQPGSSTLKANGNEGDRPHRVVSTPISNSKVLRDSIASPAQLAKAYMGSRPSKVSPSMLGNHYQVAREEVPSKTLGMSLTTKTAVGPGSPVNGFITSSRSRGRSAIYNMSRSVYLKRSGTNYNGYAGPTMPSTSLSLEENSERSEPKSMTLKRRSYALDDEVGSVGPIRRIRQKSNLISPGISHINGVGNDYDAAAVSSKQKLPLIGDRRRVPKTFAKTTDNAIPRTSYAQGPSSSSEVAVRILGHLEKLTPKEKSSGSPFKLTPSMLCGQALRSMEDMSSSELLLNVQDDLKFESRSNGTLLEGLESISQEPDATLLDVGDYTSQENGKVEEDGPVESCVPSDTCYRVINSDSAVTLKTSGVRVGTSESAVENGVSQPQNKRAFRMSALEDYVELDDDLPCNGFASPPFSGERGQLEALGTVSKLSPAEEPKLVTTTMQPEVKSPSSLMLSKTSELSAAALVGERSNVITNPASKEATMAAQSPLFSTPVFSFSSKVADKFPSLLPESSSRTPESSNSILNTSAPTGSSVKIPEPEKDGHMKPLAAEDRNGKSDYFPSAESNGPLVSDTSAGSFTAASNNTNQISAGSLIFTPSTSVSNPLSSGKDDITLATSGSSILGEGATPTIFGGPDLKFGAFLDPSTKVSTGSALIVPAEGDLKRKAVTDLTANSAGTVSQGTSAQLFSFSSAASSNTNSSTTSVSSLPSSLVFNPATPFSFNSSASSSSTGSVVSSSGATSSLFGVNPTPASNGSAASSSSTAAPSLFSFGFSSSSSSNNAVGSTGGATPPVFSFGMSSSVSASVSSTTSLFSSSATSINAVGSTGAAAPIFSFGTSSSVPASITNGTSSFSSPSSSTNAVGSTGSAAPVFGFGASSSVPASVTNTTSSFSSGASGVFSFGGSSSASSSAINSDSTSNAFGSSWQTPKSSIFSSTVASASANGFSFGASSTSSAPTNAVPVVFNSSTAPSSSSPFSFTTSNVISSPSPSLPQPVFGNPASGFAASPGNNDQMNAEDSMAEDPVQSTAPSVPIFGQTSVPPSQPGFMFGSTVPAQPQPPANPFQFGGQQNQVAPQNPPMFQASGSLEFNAGGSFSLGSGAGDKSGRKYVKINRSKNRKK